MNGLEGGSRVREGTGKEKKARLIPAGAMTWGPVGADLTKARLIQGKIKESHRLLREIATGPSNRAINLKRLQRNGDWLFENNKKGFNDVASQINWQLLIGLAQTGQTDDVKLEAVTVLAVYARHASFPAVELANKDAMNYLLQFMRAVETSDRKWFVRVFLQIMKSRAEVRNFLLQAGIVEMFDGPDRFFSKFLVRCMAVEPAVPEGLQGVVFAAMMMMLGSGKPRVVEPFLRFFKKRPALFWTNQEVFQIVMDKVMLEGDDTNVVIILAVLEKCQKAAPEEFGTRIPPPLYWTYLMQLINNRQKAEVQNEVLRILINNREMFRGVDASTVVQHFLQVVNGLPYKTGMLCTEFLLLYFDFQRGFEPHIVELVFRYLGDKSFTKMALMFLAQFFEKGDDEKKQVVMEMCLNYSSELENVAESEDSEVSEAAMALLRMMNG